jgi:hypothetical protein
MGIKSEKTFEEICERLVALFRPLHHRDPRRAAFINDTTDDYRDGSDHTRDSDPATHSNLDEQARTPG